MKLFGQFLIASTLCLLSLGSSAQAADHIKDSLELFSDKAKAAANQQIAQVYKNHGWTIAVETRDAGKTIADLPKDKEDQDKFLSSWTTKEYVANRLEGVYLVVFKNPNKIRIHIDTDQQKKMGVAPADIKEWISELGKNLKDEKFDAGLLTTVGEISAKLSQSNAPKKAVAAPPTPMHAEQKAHGGGPRAHAPADEGASTMTWLLVAGGVFIIFLIIRSVLRGINQGNASQNPYGPGGANMGGPNMGQPGYGQGYGAPPSRGGGFMSGMLGGLFGGMAGNWMYDQFSGRRDSHSDSGQGHYTSHDSSRDVSDSYVDNSSNSAESDSTTYGGDWGDSGGSNDSGGGDWGGDSGGGGDAGGDW